MISALHQVADNMMLLLGKLIGQTLLADFYGLLLGSVDHSSTNFVQSKSVLSKACIVHIVILCKRRITQRRTLLDEPEGQHLCALSTALSPAYVE